MLEIKYDHKKVEEGKYEYWLNNNYFMSGDKTKTPFSMVLPPPNITGKLHIGHAQDVSIQDIICRYKRMDGYDVLWLPGMDHAAIATEAKVVAKLKKEGINKYELGRENFLKEAWKWKDEYADNIRKQWSKMGISLDYSKERFTLDEVSQKAVNYAFIKMYNDGLIYRGKKIINWDPEARTALSNEEVIYKDVEGAFYHLKYYIEGTNDYLDVATTRPETLFGDTAVAVNPKDERYNKLIGKNVILPIVGKLIPIIGDEHADMEKGTGVVKITPAHDPNDFEVGNRHNLERIVVMDETAHMNENALNYKGLDRFEAREKLIEELKEKDLLISIEKITHSVGHSERTGVMVEPYLSEQWFVKMSDLAHNLLENQKTDNKVNFYPARCEKVLENWMNDCHDWCISRQLWWGIRVPAWYKDNEVKVQVESPGEGWIQDEDVLDTWFSSALWPFSTLGWPDNTDLFNRYYPTNALVTGYDIIFFWVARMIFSACENMGSAPFKTVFMHGIVRDENGIKMSKSLGNGIDPLEVIDKYGADALRFFLATGNTPGNDMRYSDKRVEACANFANKLWNASRCVHMNIDDHDVKNELPKTLTTEDKWIVSTLNTVAKEVNENLEKFELGIAVQKIYEFIWDCYCDWYIELVKTRLSSDGEDAQNARQVLLYVLDQILRLLHPFMPYITEEIWQTIPHEGETVMLAKYPEYNAELDYPEASDEMKKIMDAIRAIRNRRAEMNVPPSRKAKVYVATKFADTFRDGTQFIQKLASASEVEVAESFEIEGAVNIVTADAKIYIPMDELVDREKELARLNKELEQVKKRLAQSEGKLNNQGFVAKAPEAVIEKVKGQAAKEREQIALIEAAIAALK